MRNAVISFVLALAALFTTCQIASAQVFTVDVKLFTNILINGTSFDTTSPTFLVPHGSPSTSQLPIANATYPDSMEVQYFTRTNGQTDSVYDIIDWKSKPTRNDMYGPTIGQTSASYGGTGLPQVTNFYTALVDTVKDTSKQFSVVAYSLYAGRDSAAVEVKGHAGTGLQSNPAYLTCWVRKFFHFNVYVQKLVN
jgi:hypothetical protein